MDWEKAITLGFMSKKLMMRRDEEKESISFQGLGESVHLTISCENRLIFITSSCWRQVQM